MSSHKDLVEVARQWLQKKGMATLTELGTVGSEMPDAIGFKSDGSILIECKASRADFLADQRKFFRLNPEFGLGAYRYYLCPKSLLKPEDMPQKWGLLWTDKGRVYTKVKPEHFFGPKQIAAEHKFMLSIMRRLNNAGCFEPGVELDKLKNQLNKDILGINLKRADESRKHVWQIHRLQNDIRLYKRHLALLNTLLEQKKQEVLELGMVVNLDE